MAYERLFKTTTEGVLFGAVSSNFTIPVAIQATAKSIKASFKLDITSDNLTAVDLYINGAIATGRLGGWLEDDVAGGQLARIQVGGSGGDANFSLGYGVSLIADTDFAHLTVDIPNAQSGASPNRHIVIDFYSQITSGGVPYTIVKKLHGYFANTGAITSIGVKPATTGAFAATSSWSLTVT